MEQPIFREPGEEASAEYYEDWSTAATASGEATAAASTAATQPAVKAALICGDAAVGTNVWRRCDVIAHVPGPG